MTGHESGQHSGVNRPGFRTHEHDTSVPHRCPAEAPQDFHVAVPATEQNEPFHSHPLMGCKRRAEVG